MNQRTVVPAALAAIGALGGVVGLVTDVGPLWTLSGFGILILLLGAAWLRQHANDSRLSGELAALRCQLNRVTKDVHFDLRHEEVRARLEIDEDSARDKWILFQRTIVTGQAPCHWARVLFEAGPESVTHRGFSVRLLPNQCTGTGREYWPGELIVLEKTTERWEGVVLFDPPIGAEHAVDWAVEVVAPRLADEYRQSGRGTSKFRSSQRIAQLTLEVVLRGGEHRHARVTKHSPPTGDVRSPERTHDEVLLAWSVVAPERGVLHTVYFTNQAG